MSSQILLALERGLKGCLISAVFRKHWFVNVLTKKTSLDTTQDTDHCKRYCLCDIREGCQRYNPRQLTYDTEIHKFSGNNYWPTLLHSKKLYFHRQQLWDALPRQHLATKFEKLAKLQQSSFSSTSRFQAFTRRTLRSSACISLNETKRIQRQGLWDRRSESVLFIGAHEFWV